MQDNQTKKPVTNSDSEPSVVESKLPATSSDVASPAPLALKKRRSVWKWIVGIFVVLIVVACAVVGGVWHWYQQQLVSPNPGSQETVRFDVKSGYTSADVASALTQQGMIKNQRAFEIYYRLNHSAGFKAGVYVLHKNMNVQDIVAHLEEGKPDEFNLTFLPGATILDAKKVLIEAGYAEKDIDAAFMKRYDHPLLKGRPADADLEGYIYGDTYSFFTDSSLDTILTKVFDHMYADIQGNKLEAAYAAKGMTLYEGIIFASIVQSEVSNKSDMAHVSQVFHKRLAEDMPLGSDVTFIYGARKLGVAPTVDLNSPYNTRVLQGLTPTPVSNPGIHALIAGANPSDTDDVYFVAGDDGKTYFSKTNEEHERLTREHCQQNCLLPSR